MAGTTVTIENPDLVETKNVDSNGRLFLGKDYEGAEVRVVIEMLQAPPDDPENDEQEQEDANPSDGDSDDSEGSNSDPFANT